jgi:hypothetical protein
VLLQLQLGWSDGGRANPVRRAGFVGGVASILAALTACCSQTMRISLYKHQLTEDQAVQLQRAIDLFHAAQDQIILEPAGRRVLGDGGDRVSFTDDILPLPRGDRPEITATGLRLVDNWFTHTAGGRAVMTLTDWQVAFLEEVELAHGDPDPTQPFPTAAPDAYLLQSLTLVTFLIVAGARDYDYLHEATTGCISDLCGDKRTRAIKMRAGYVCPRCLAKASAAGVSPVTLDAIRALAECVRSLAIGREPQPRANVASTESDDNWIANASLPEGIRLPPNLVEACRNRRLTVVVGSGMSLQPDVTVNFSSATGWNALPAWSEVPSRLAGSLRRYRDRHDEPRKTADLAEFLTDMDFFRSALGERAYYPRAIFDAFAPVVRSPGRANRLVFRLPVCWVLTTNYDLVLNHAAPPGTATFTWREARQAREYLERAEGAAPPLVKLHGCASRPDTVVLTQSEYVALQADAAYASMMRFVFESMSVLFLGFGLRDPLDLDLAMDEAEHAGAAQGEKFAVLPRASAPVIRDRFPMVNVLEYDDPGDVPLVIAGLVRKSAATD